MLQEREYCYLLVSSSLSDGLMRWAYGMVYIAAGSGCSACKERRVVWNRGRWDQMQQAAGLLGECVQNKRASQTLQQLLQ